jgi:hypothetical protein
MNAVRPSFLFILLCALCLLPSVNTAPANEPDKGLVEVESQDQKIARLEKMILELQDANSMFMENLASCIEENEALRGRAAPVKRKVNLPENRYRLIERLRVLLGTSSDLSFLKELDDEHLKTLLEIIRNRVKLQR